MTQKTGKNETGKTRRAWTGIALLFILAFASQASFALATEIATDDDIVVTKTLSQLQVQPNEWFSVNLTVTNNLGTLITADIYEPYETEFRYYQPEPINISENMIAYPPRYVRIVENISARGSITKEFVMRIRTIGPFYIPETIVNVGDKTYFSNPLNLTVMCNLNGVCEPELRENYETCPEDCPPGSQDGICSMEKDNILDPDCLAGYDSDYVPEHCYNGVRDNGELWTDCGIVCEWSCKQGPHPQPSYEQLPVVSHSCEAHASFITYDSRNYPDKCLNPSQLLNYSCGGAQNSLLASNVLDCEYGCENDACAQCGNGVKEGTEECDGGACCTGNCTFQPIGTPCDDGLFCTDSDVCSSGACSGTPKDCSDITDCTIDSCDEGSDSCQNVPDDSQCPADGWHDLGEPQWVDTDQCNEKEQKLEEYWDYICLWTCVPLRGEEPRWTDTGNTRYKPDGTPCDDGLFCTDSDVCSSGACSGTPKDCSDGVDCTDDSCDEGSDACANTANDAYCDDGIFCTVDTCNTVSGCYHEPSDALCAGSYDLEWCAVYGCYVACEEGYGCRFYINTMLACNDSNDCTADSYNSGLGVCENVPIDADNDAHSICPPNPDCNDSDATVYPGAHEALNGVDDDCDGFIDEGFVVGTTPSGYSATIGGNPVTPGQKVTGIQEVAFSEDGQTVLEFEHDFDEGNLDLSEVSIETTANSILVNLHGQLLPGEAKTLYLKDNGFSSLCVKDAEVASIGEMSDACNGTGETSFTSCLGSSSGVTIDGITCTDLGATIKVEGLAHSAILAIPAIPTAPQKKPKETGGAVQGYIATPQPPAQLPKPPEEEPPEAEPPTQPPTQPPAQPPAQPPTQLPAEQPQPGLAQPSLEQGWYVFFAVLFAICLYLVFKRGRKSKKR